MPKLKTHRGAAKRIRVTAKGKLKRSKAYKSHLLTSKDSKRRRHLDVETYVSPADEASIKRLLPYGRP